MLLNIDQFLDSSTHTSRSLMAVALSTPFLMVFWASHTAALLHPDIRLGIHVEVVQTLHLVLTLSILFNLGMGRWLWSRRLQSDRRSTSSLIVALNIGVMFMLIMIAYGAFSTGGNLVMFGVMVIGLLLFDQRTMVIAFVVCMGLHIVADLAVMSNWLPYAPIIGTGAFVNEQPTWWWEFARSALLFASWAAVLPLILLLFARLDALHSQLSKLSYTDVLTGLSNRRYFMDRLSSETKRQKRTLQPYSLVLLDADHFKRVNDLFGHAAGDQVLRFLADTLVAGLRTPTDQPARLGGEEFGILLPDTRNEDAAVVCQRIATALREHEFEAQGQRFTVTVSMGVVECLHVDAEAALKQADKNLYQAKNQGRDAIVCSTMSEATGP